MIGIVVMILFILCRTINAGIIVSCFWFVNISFPGIKTGKIIGQVISERV